MPPQLLERTRRLIDAALAHGIISDDERTAVARVLARGGLDPLRLETAFAALMGQLESIQRDLYARRRAFDRFFDRIEGRGDDGPRAAAGGAAVSPRRSAGPAAGTLGWAGNLGRIVGPDAEYSRGVPEPTYFVRSLSGRDAMVLTAETYVAGVTDHPSADLSGLIAEVITDLGSPDGKVRPVTVSSEVDGRRVSNNLRVHWNVAPLVARSASGRFQYQFRFSGDGGATWVGVPDEPRHLVVASDVRDVPAEALVESSLLFKVGEVSPARIGWMGPATVRADRDMPAQSLPAEVSIDPSRGEVYFELAVQIWAPSVSNRADLTPEEHTLALKQLGLRVESPFFVGAGTKTLGFAGKAGIHEHDDIARFNLGPYLEELERAGVAPPPEGDYPFTVFAGDKDLGTVVLHWRR